MIYLKRFISGGLIFLFLNLIVVNLLTLYHDMYQINIDMNLKLFNIPLVSIERNSSGFGYVFMGGGMLLSILMGGIITLAIYTITQHKNKLPNF